MSDYLTAAIQEVQALVASTWPDIVDLGGKRRIYEVEHVANLVFEQRTLPYAVLLVRTTPAEMSLDRNDVLLDCEVYRVDDEDAGGPPNALRASLQELRDALWPNAALNLSQVWDDPKPTPSWSLALEINRLLKGKKIPHLAGRVAFRLLTGEPD